MNDKLISAIYAVGGLMTVVGAMVYITKWEYSPYIYMIGATLFALAHINSPYKGSNHIIKRLKRQQLLGSLCLVGAGALMFFTTHNEWLLAFAIGSLLELYTAFRIPHEEKREQNR